MKKLCGLILALTCVLLCGFINIAPIPYYPKLPPNTIVIRKVPLTSSFNTLNINGPYQVTLVRTAYPGGYMTVTGPCRYLGHIPIRQYGGHLMILGLTGPEQVAGQPDNNPIQIRIPVSYKQSLTATVAGTARLNTLNLRLYSINIKTMNYAHADVAACCLINAVALGHSSIYYYDVPSHLNNYAFGAGSILPM